MGRARTTLAAIALCRAFGCTDTTEVLIPSDGGGEPGDGGAPDVDAGSDPPLHPVIIAISTKVDDTCALTQDASLYCWGETFGLSPTSVDLTDVVAFSVGQGFVCALVSAGPVRCFPEQSDGASLGRQGSNNDVAAGGDFACALVGQTVECWGDNFWGQLGNGDMHTENVPPSPVVGLPPAKLVSAGYQHVCSVTQMNQAYCWGFNGTNQLDGVSAENRTTATLVPNIEGVRDLSAGYGHTCVANDAGEVWCWGDIYLSDSGDRNPRRVRGIDHPVQLSSGSSHACAVTADQRALCWGMNSFSQLGGSIGPAIAEATHVDFGRPVTAIAAGDRHTCAVTTDGQALCVGDNQWGQLGDGTNEDSSIPVEVRWPD